MLKKISAMLLLATSLYSAEMDMGFGLFSSKAEGKLIYQTDFFKGSSAQIDNASQYHIYIWSEFDLEISYVPKFRIEYTRVRSSGSSYVHIETQNDLINELIDTIGGPDFEQNSILTHNMYDAFGYYEFFEDSDFPDMAFGAGIKNFDYDYDVEIYEGVQFNDQGGATIPLVYFKIRGMLPDSQIGLESDVKYYVTGDSDIRDIRAKMDFLFELNSKIHAGLEIGYRDVYFGIQGSDVDNVGGNMHYSGLFFGVSSTFR